MPLLQLTDQILYSALLLLLAAAVVAIIRFHLPVVRGRLVVPAVVAVGEIVAHQTLVVREILQQLIQVKEIAVETGKMEMATLITQVAAAVHLNRGKRVE
jgi:hypothetical protein